MICSNLFNAEGCRTCQNIISTRQEQTLDEQNRRTDTRSTHNPRGLLVDGGIAGRRGGGRFRVGGRRGLHGLHPRADPAATELELGEILPPAVGPGGRVGEQGRRAGHRRHRDGGHGLHRHNILLRHRVSREKLECNGGVSNLMGEGRRRKDGIFMLLVVCRPDF